MIELLIASAIIGVLVSSAFFFLDPAEQLKKSHDSQRKNDLEQVRIALDAYYNDNNRYPTVTEVSWGNSWVPYMAKISKDPLPNQNYLYEVSFDRSSYRLYAKLERCSDPQIITGIDCATASYNYSVTSSNTSVIPFGAPTPTP